MADKSKRLVETDAQRLSRLGSKMVSNLGKNIRRLGNLHKHKPNQQQTTAAFDYLQKSLDEAKKKWQNPPTSTKAAPEFKL